MISMDHIEVYKNRKGKWCWRYRSSNGRTMADGSQGYVTKPGCLKAMRRVLNDNDLPDFPPVHIL